MPKHHSNFMCAATRISLHLCSLALLVACAAERSSQRHHIDSLPQLTATIDQRIGSTSDPDLGFTRIGAVDVDRDGNVYVLEAADRQIRVYGPELRLLRRIGRAGQGPGEFQRAPTFGVAGDTVWTLDGIPTTITLFSREGAVLSTGKTSGVKVLLPGTTIGTVAPVSRRRDGRFTSEFVMVSGGRDIPASGVRETDSIPVPRVVFDASGAVVDTIGFDEKPPPRMWRAPGSYPTEGMWRTITMNDRPYSVPDPPTTMPEWLTLQDGRIVVETAQPASAADTTFTVTRLTLELDTVYHRALHYTPIRYESTELDSIAHRASFGMFTADPAQTRRADPVVAARLRAEMKFPDFKMPIVHPWLAQDESVWILRDDTQPATNRWIILDFGGAVEGQLELPARFRPLWRKGAVLWGSELDDADVPWLVRYGISRGR